MNFTPHYDTHSLQFIAVMGLLVYCTGVNKCSFWHIYILTIMRKVVMWPIYWLNIWWLSWDAVSSSVAWSWYQTWSPTLPCSLATTWWPTLPCSCSPWCPSYCPAVETTTPSTGLSPHTLVYCQQTQFISCEGSKTLPSQERALRTCHVKWVLSVWTQSSYFGEKSFHF